MGCRQRDQQLNCRGSARRLIPARRCWEDGYILTAEIARATFGVTPGAHRRLKSLDKVKTGNNLRDHMTDLELIFTMLGEASTTEIARRKDAQGFDDNRVAAKEGGTVAGNARKDLEARSGKPVVSRANYLALESNATPVAPEAGAPVRIAKASPKGAKGRK